MTATYDAIVVGARCAGSPAAMLLARKGHRVLLVDRGSFPSDTLSCHFLHQPGVARLQSWGLLPEVARSNCPPVRSQLLDVGPFALKGSPAPAGEVTDAYAVRRTVLDKILIDAAARAGAEVRERFSVDELLADDGRVTGIRGREAGSAAVTERARIVIGADGRNSLVARSVAAPSYNVHPSLTCAYYSYWSGVELEAAELYSRPGQMIVAAPTNDGQVFVIVYWPNAAFHRVRSDIEGSFMSALDLAPGLADRIRGGTRSERFRGTGTLPNFYRRPHGDGWALVGDAGYHKDPITALGMTDAFRDAELLADAIDAGLSGRQPLNTALAEYEWRRNEATGETYETTIQFAQLEPPPAEMQPLFEALRDNEEETGRLFGTVTGTVSAAEFYGPENIARIVGESGRERAKPVAIG
jgi:flavin-dependent dehydrogenase